MRAGDGHPTAQDVLAEFNAALQKFWSDASSVIAPVVAALAPLADESESEPEVRERERAAQPTRRIRAWGMCDLTNPGGSAMLVNVLDFGATQGLADDTDAIRSALDAACLGQVTHPQGVALMRPRAPVSRRRFARRPRG